MIIPGLDLRERVLLALKRAYAMPHRLAVEPNVSLSDLATDVAADLERSAERRRYVCWTHERFGESPTPCDGKSGIAMPCRVQEKP